MNDEMKAARALVEQRIVSMEALWLRYWANGGQASEEELDAYVHGALEPEKFDLLVIRWALEELTNR